MRAAFSLRRFLLAIIVLLSALALSAPAAHATTVAGSGAGPGGTGIHPIPGNGPGITVWDLRNVNAQLPWGQYKNQLDAARSAVQKSCSNSPGYTGTACSLTANQTYSLSKLIGPDQCSGNYTQANCLLWKDYRSPDSNWGYQQHEQLWSGDMVSDDGITGWNIRIWREGDNTPIFERRVCIEPATGRTDGSEASDYQSLWWNCGTNTTDQYATNQSLAGMLQGGGEPSKCVSNYNNGVDGTLGLNGKPASKKNPAVPG